MNSTEYIDVLVLSQQVEHSQWQLVTPPAQNVYKKCCASPGWQLSSQVNKGKKGTAQRQRLQIVMEGGSFVLLLDVRIGMWPDHSTFLSSLSSTTELERFQESSGQIRQHQPLPTDGLTGNWKLPKAMGKGLSVPFFTGYPGTELLLLALVM